MSMDEEDPGDRLPDFAERVLDLAERIPPGRVMTYGDVAEWLEEGGPRQVGRVMALYGGAVPWWRVVRADGVLLPGHEQRALEHYRAEGTPLRGSGRTGRGSLPRLDTARARWDGRRDDPGTCPAHDGRPAHGGQGAHDGRPAHGGRSAHGGRGARDAQGRTGPDGPPGHPDGSA
nr:MGMT family protein [Streptomyces sp. HB2AG]